MYWARILSDELYMYNCTYTDLLHSIFIRLEMMSSSLIPRKRRFTMRKLRRSPNSRNQHIIKELIIFNALIFRKISIF